MNDYLDQRVTVMGLGRFGGGLGVTRFLAQRGAKVLVTDRLAADQLAESVKGLQDLIDAGSVTLRLGEHVDQDFTRADLLVVNPAVPPGNQHVAAAQSAGVPITSEIRLLVKHLPNRSRTIGITGSAGKSTTTAMITHVLRDLLSQIQPTPRRGPSTRPATPSIDKSQTRPGVWMGGNIGGSLLPRLPQIREDDWVVLELSSFMLEGLRQDRWSPHIALLANLSPNHLDWHGSMQAYVRAKFGLVEFQQPRDFALFDESVVERLTEFGLIPAGKRHWPGGPRRGHRCRVTPLSEEVRYDLNLPGDHNQGNAAFAAYAVEVALTGSLPPTVPETPEVQTHRRLIRRIAESIKTFPGLPHRLEYLGRFAGFRCYNDSKSTTPEAAALAIESFPDAPIHLILGGYDKGSDYASLAQLAARRCTAVYTIGAVGDRLADLVGQEWHQNGLSPSPTSEDSGQDMVADPRGSACLHRCATLDVAVARAFETATAAGKSVPVLVLSPGCASWDQYDNYEARGQHFARLVEANA